MSGTLAGMEKLVLTIDCGTSNSRVRIWRGGTVVARGDASAGVRDTAMTGNRTALTAGLRIAIDRAFENQGTSKNEIQIGLASGMITSALGLVELPHVLAPVSAADLGRAMRASTFPELCPFPLWFIPGVRHDAAPVTLDSVGAMDMMRGEETETFGLIERLDLKGPCVVLFPGSHAKFVRVDANGRIAGCVSTLSGELLDVLMRNTVLASGLQQGWPDAIDESALIVGASLARAEGLNRAVFSTRVLELFSPLDSRARFCFLLGAVLAQDLLACARHSSLGVAARQRLIICGKPLVQAAYGALARWIGDFASIDAPEQIALEDLAGLGAIAIARLKGLV